MVAAIDFHLSTPELSTLLPTEATVTAALVESGGIGCNSFSNSGVGGGDSNPTAGGCRRTLQTTSQTFRNATFFVKPRIRRS